MVGRGERGRDAAVALRTARTFSSVFNSSVPQRPVQKSMDRQFGGRPLGPNTYHPTPPPWHYDPNREGSTFASKTQLRSYETPITAQLDFLGHAGQVPLTIASAPLSRTYRASRGRSVASLVRTHGRSRGARRAAVIPCDS